MRNDKVKRKALLIFTFLVYPDAPASLTANAQSVTFGSILPFFHISILLGAAQLEE